MRLTTCVLSVCVVITSGTLGADSPVWPQFRGPDGLGIADGSSLPTHWSASRNVAWAVALPGRGWSSPVVWRDRVFVTSAVNSNDFKEPWTGIFGNDAIAELQKQGVPEAEAIRRVRQRDFELTDEAGEVSYMVFALEVTTGRIVWQHEAHRGTPFGGRHRKNTYATETPATDGERLYVSFGGNVGVFSYTYDGELLWKRTWAPQPMFFNFGTASSPVVHDGRVYQLHDNEGQSFLAALDAETGREMWNVPRTESAGPAKSGWATPFVWAHDTRTEVVTIGRNLVISYDTNGRELWRLDGMSQATPSPVAGNGLLFVGSGSQGDANRPLLAIRPGASGDISLDTGQKSNEFVAWFVPRFTGYTPSPLVYRGRVYAVNDNGVLQVADTMTGPEVYKARVGGGGGGHTFSSSPIASGGYIYLLTEDGDTFVLRAGDRYDEVARNSLNEMSLSSPAADLDSLYIRTKEKLYRIRERPQAPDSPKP
jgi:outer membrane protein assembly factor BamB